MVGFRDVFCFDWPAKDTELTSLCLKLTLAATLTSEERANQEERVSKSGGRKSKP